MLISTLRRQRLKDHKFKDNLGFIVRLCQTDTQTHRQGGREKGREDRKGESFTCF